MLRYSSLLVVAGLGAAPLAAAAQNPSRAAGAFALREQVDRVRADVAARAVRYQGRDRGPEQTERFSRKVKLGRDGRFTIENISGDITVTGGSGDDVSIEAVKRTRGGAGQLASVRILVDERPGRVEVRTEHTAQNDRVSVDYTVTVPSAAAVDARSVSGTVKVTRVQGAVRAETVSGNIVAASTPKLDAAKTVSGNVDLTDATSDADLTASTVSGTLRAKGLKARALELGSVSGDVLLSDVSCERLSVHSVSGSLEYAGALARRGRYEINTHSGSVRLTLSSDTGFELTANSFSGSIRSDLPVTLGGTSNQDDRRRRGPGHSTHAVYGDGSAALSIRTFSGDIVINKR